MVSVSEYPIWLTSVPLCIDQGATAAHVSWLCWLLSDSAERESCLYRFGEKLLINMSLSEVMKLLRGHLGTILIPR